MFFHCSEKPIVAQLGFRFWDPVRNAQVSDGLEVTARTVNPYSRISQAFQTPSGIYAFHGLPGFHDLEYPSNDLSKPGNQKRTKLIIEVTDLQHRFLPFSFLWDEEIPSIYTSWQFVDEYPACPPEPALPVLYLYSAQTRPLMPGMAAVRCSLKEYPGKKSAAHAFIEIDIKGKKWLGMADEDGNAAVFFPYPAVDNVFYGTSPPLPVSQPFNCQKWQVAVGISYSPATFTPLPEAGRSESSPLGVGNKGLPEFRSILRQQRARIWSHDPESTVGTTAVYELDEELTYGQELVLRTENKSELFLELLPTSP